LTPNYDVVVVGGGAIGAACARELAAAGRQVLILEPGGESGQAWRAAAGMLAPQIEADASDPLLRLGLSARDHYDVLVPALQETTGFDIGLWREGIARVATEPGEATNLQAKVAWQQRQGYACEWLDGGQLRQRWPWLGPAIGALWAPRDGALDPERLVQALLTDASRLGANVVTDRATAILKTGDRVVGVRSEAGEYRAPDVVLAAGAWSGLVQNLPRPLPVRPVRGQMLALPWPAGVDRAIVYRNDCYILTRGGEAIVGSTMEDAGFRPEVTPAGVASVLSAALSLCPALLRAKVRRTWAGLRPMMPDGLPVIGAEPELPGLWYATGHGRNGILLAGLTGALLRQLMMGQPPTHDLTAFTPARFATS
jgi:glycine oxidase